MVGETIVLLFVTAYLLLLPVFEATMNLLIRVAELIFSLECKKILRMLYILDIRIVEIAFAE